MVFTDIHRLKQNVVVLSNNQQTKKIQYNNQAAA